MFLGASHVHNLLQLATVVHAAPRPRAAQGHAEPVRAVATCRAEGADFMVVSCSDDRTLRLWDAAAATASAAAETSSCRVALQVGAWVAYWRVGLGVGVTPWPPQPQLAWHALHPRPPAAAQLGGPATWRMRAAEQLPAM